MSVPIPFGTNRFQDGVTSRCDSSSLLFSPKGLNLDSVDQNHVSCQVRRGENYEANMSKNFFFLFEVPIRFELMTPGYKAGVLPNYTKEPNFWV